jgi:ribosome maturation factor RimP
MPDISVIRSTIASVVGPIAASLSLDLYDVEVSGTGRTRVVRVLIDREAGLDLDAVARASQAISLALDDPSVDAVVSGPYALEVSSPGLERPLRTAAHFRGALGATVSVKTKTADGSTRRVRGVVVASDEEGFELTREDDGAREQIPFADVVQARTVFEWESQPGRRKAAGKRTKEVVSQ